MSEVQKSFDAMDIARKQKEDAGHAIEDILSNLDRQKSLPPSRKISEIESPTRQRKISHRKVIIHDDGNICNRTYNKPCPHDNDPDHDNPPMLHEAGDESFPHGFQPGSSPFSPGFMPFPGMAGLMGATSPDGMSGKNGMTPDAMQSMMQMAAMQGMTPESMMQAAAMQGMPPEAFQGMMGGMPPEAMQAMGGMPGMQNMMAAMAAGNMEGMKGKEGQWGANFVIPGLGGMTTGRMTEQQQQHDVISNN